jgi:hypothetical protein
VAQALRQQAWVAAVQQYLHALGGGAPRVQ